jgi:soluble lytic murein transglycosylase-like protein
MASPHIYRIYLFSTFLIMGMLASDLVVASVQQPPDQDLRKLLIEAVNNSRSFEDRYDAEVWLADMSQRLAPKIPDAGERLNLLRMIHYEATRANLPPELVLAVIEVESDFDRWAISASGAEGLMQVMPFWLKEIGHPSDNLHQPETNLRIGCTILRYYIDIENGDLTRGLARYNGSQGQAAYSYKVIDALRFHWYRQ